MEVNMWEAILVKAKVLLTWKIIIPFVALIIMYFTPDNIDKIIIGFLRDVGFSEDILDILARLGSENPSEVESIK